MCSKILFLQFGRMLQVTKLFQGEWISAWASLLICIFKGFLLKEVKILKLLMHS